MVKTFLIEDPTLTTRELQELLTEAELELSDLVVAATRSEFLRSVRFLQERKLLNRRLIDEG